MTPTKQKPKKSATRSTQRQAQAKKVMKTQAKKQIHPTPIKKTQAVKPVQTIAAVPPIQPVPEAKVVPETKVIIEPMFDATPTENVEQSLPTAENNTPPVTKATQDEKFAGYGATWGLYAAALVGGLASGSAVAIAGIGIVGFVIGAYITDRITEA